MDCCIANTFHRPLLLYMISSQVHVLIVDDHSPDQTRQHIEKDGALERRFQKVIVEPTTVEETIEILNNIKNKYEDHHNVDYTRVHWGLIKFKMPGSHQLGILKAIVFLYP